MDLLNTLKNYAFIDEDVSWIKFDDFVKLFKDEADSKGKLKSVPRKDNILRFFKTSGYIRNEKELKDVDISCKGVLHYAFHNRTTIDIFDDLTERLVYNIFGNSPRPNIRELYGEIARNPFHILESSSYYTSEDCLTQDSDLRTLITEYKADFSNIQWERIKLFEWHFEKCDKANVQKSNDITERKYQFYDQCLRAKKECTNLNQTCKETISSEKRRQDLGKTAHESQLLYGKCTHNRDVLEQSIRDCLKQCDPRLKFDVMICLSCQTYSCKDVDGIHVCLSLEGENVSNLELENVVQLIQHEIENHHNDFCHSIKVFASQSLSPYKDSKGNFDSYSLFNDLELGIIKEMSVPFETSSEI